MRSARHTLALFGSAALALLLAGPARAQDIPAAPLLDPAALAERYLGLPPDTALPIPDLRDLSPGTSETVLLPLQGSDTPAPVEITLRGGARANLNVPGALVWVADGVEASDQAVRAAAQALAGLFAELSSQSYYDAVTFFPGTTSIIPSDPIRVPDVDQDGFIHVVFARDIASDRDAWVNPVDLLPAPYAPAMQNNARELMIVNTTPYGPDIAIDDPLYMGAAAGAFIELVLDTNNPQLPAWLRALVTSDIQSRLSEAGIGASVFEAWLGAPSTPVTAAPTFANREIVRGGHALFLGYLRQRLGGEALASIALTSPVSADPFDVLDQAAARSSAVDPVTGAPPDVRALYADFVMTAIINAAFGDGRYVFNVMNVSRESGAAATQLVADSGAEGEILPFAASYFYLTAREEALTIDLTFDGADAAPSLRLPEDTPHETVYWSGRVPGSNPHMTRALDLTAATGATLTFDAWHDLAAGWDYSYVSISTDGGATWQAQPLLDADGEPVSVANPYGAAYGPGITGVSSPQPIEPFPILGVVIATDGLTVGDLSAGGAAEAAGVLPGDRILGAEGQPWEGQPNIVGLLAAYSPGDTITLLIEREGEQIDLPVVLGAHPTRVRVPEPLWQARRVDLGAFAGQEILLRFEAVLRPGRDGWGTALADIRVPEIDFIDDGSGTGWSFDGFSTISTTLAPEWLVQTATTGIVGAAPPRVMTLLEGTDETFSVTRRYALGRNETLIIAISATNVWTGAALPFTLTAAQVDGG
jgi:hypothetical protein